MLVPQELIIEMSGRNQPAAQERRLKGLGYWCWRNAENRVCMPESELHKRPSGCPHEPNRPKRKSQK